MVAKDEILTDRLNSTLAEIKLVLEVKNDKLFKELAAIGWVMNIEEFELNYRNGIDDTLNQLQTAVLLLAQLEDRITVIGQDLQNLSQTVEEFVTQQRDEWFQKGFYDRCSSSSIACFKSLKLTGLTK